MTDWAVRLQDIWTAAVGDVPDMHGNARRSLLTEAEWMKDRPEAGAALESGEAGPFIDRSGARA